MRTLVLMRGAPGCGKSTWIREQGLEEYALSADTIRGLFASPELGVSGKPVVSQRNDKVVWETLFAMLERRMQRGDFTIIDACNSKTSEMKRYKTLAEHYRYRIYCVDMTDIPIEEVLRRNASRTQKKIVPEEYISRVYSRFETQQIPSGIRRVKPDDFDSVFNTPVDLSKYDKVVHIGDIHGCNDALQKVFENGVDPNTAYIFFGDYGDRGADTPDVIRFLIDISQLENVCLIEGNHEAHLWAWANGTSSRSREFETRTKFQLEAANIAREDVRKLYRKFRQCSLYTWRGTTVLCTHGGLPNINAFGRIDFVPTYQMIHGVGAYENMADCAASFEKQDDSINFQVFGHRNIAGDRPDVTQRSIVLEGQVERGGALRIATLSDAGWAFSEYVSEKAVSAQPKEADVQSFDVDNSDIIASLVYNMRQSPLIKEKQFGHISSFNFTRSAFADKKWNDLTVRARGLYIDTVNNKIAARGYEKFFAVNERNETNLYALAKNLQFPVEVFKKENGFLGLVSYDRATDALFISTKSTPDGDMAKLFASMLTDDVKQRATEYLKDHDVTLLFEAVHPQLDPHIIEYDSPQLFLLDSIENTLNFQAAPYSQLLEIGKLLGAQTKKLVATLNNWDEFAKLYRESQQTLDSDAEPFEGYVARDAVGFMVKMKTDYYTTWKTLRGVADRVFNQGYVKYTGALTTPLMNYFYAFVKKYHGISDEHRDIIALRKIFLASQQSV